MRDETFAALAERWLQERAGELSPGSANRFANIFHLYVNPVLGERMVSSVTRQDLVQLSNALTSQAGVRKRGLAASSVNSILGVVKSVLAWAGQDVSIKPASVPMESKELRILTREEQAELVQAIRLDPKPSSLGMLICLCGGLRVGEISALRWQDISLRENRIHVHQVMQRVQVGLEVGSAYAEAQIPPRDAEDTARTKLIILNLDDLDRNRSQSRFVPISPLLRSFLLDGQREPDAYLCSGSAGSVVEPRIMMKRFRSLCKRLGIANAPFDSLRDTFAVNCVKAGMDIRILAAILGVSSVDKTARRYGADLLPPEGQDLQALAGMM